ncbi:hypothetical protein CC585_21975 [Salmonella enterica subsp. enterica serovar Limete]|nr:hypothetical protein [Salmonella enterica subsp. enterica serovar Limete]
MFCDHSQFVHVTKQRDKMCFWSTACTLMTPGQAPSDTRMFAICLLPFCYLFATATFSSEKIKAR